MKAKQASKSNKGRDGDGRDGSEINFSRDLWMHLTTRAMPSALRLFGRRGIYDSEEHHEIGLRNAQHTRASGSSERLITSFQGEKLFPFHLLVRMQSSRFMENFFLLLDCLRARSESEKNFKTAERAARQKF
jgi:hypothetical protein